MTFETSPGEGRDTADRAARAETRPSILWGDVAGFVVVALATGLLNRPGLGFEVAGGVALIYPAAAVVVVGGLLFGWWGVAGSLLGMLATPWGLADTFPRSVFFAMAASLQGAIPALMVCRIPPTTLRSVWFLMWAAVLNTFLSALVALPGMIAWSDPVLSFRQTVSAFAVWFAGDLVAVIVLAVPVIVLLRPELMMEKSNLLLFRRWVRRPGSVLPPLAGIGLLVVSIEVAAAVGFDYVHWIAAAFLVPVLWAAVEGGVGAALLINAAAGMTYIMEVVRLQPGGESTSHFVEIFSTYLNTAVFAVSAVAVGLAWGKAVSMVRDLEDHRRLLQDNFGREVTALAAAVEAKDRTSEGHVQRVARLTVEVGRKMGLGRSRLEMLHYAALLHDVGKIGIPEQVLNKPGPLNAEEKELLEKHVTIGVEILESVDILRPAIPFIEFHQECWDGCTDGDKVRYPGYFGLREEQIPVEARIIATVDAWDAMTHHRPYRQALPISEAIAELEVERGKQFDPNVVDALLALVRRNADISGSWDLPTLAAAENLLQSDSD